MSDDPRPRLARWLKTLRGDRPPAVILGASVNGLSFVRSLNRRGVPTLLLDSKRLIGIHTKLGKVALLPDAIEQPRAWLDFLQFVAESLFGQAVLFSTSDLHNELVSAHAHELERTYQFLMPDATTMQRIINKRSQYDAAQRAGVPIPLTHFPESVPDIQRIADEMKYPCILKPYKSHLGQSKLGAKVAIADSPRQLTDLYAQVASSDTPFMVQEIIPGSVTELFGYWGFFDADGVERAWLTKRKLREDVPYGNGCHQVTVRDPRVAELSRQFLRALNYRGIAATEFKRDPRDGVYRLMELNPRSVIGNQMAITAGVDFPWLTYQYLLHGADGVDWPRSFQVGVRFVDEEGDLRAFRRLHQAGELTLVGWLRSVLGSRAHAIGSWRDPWPIIVLIAKSLRGLLRAIGKRFTSL